MEGTLNVTPIESSLETYCSTLSDPLLYLSPNQHQEKKWQLILENVYNHLSDIASNEESLKSRILLPKLLVKNFDDEQIWQQIELLNDVLVDNVQSEINKKLSEKAPSPEKAETPTDDTEVEAPDPERPDISDDEKDEDLNIEAQSKAGDDEGKPSFDLADMDKFCEEVERQPDDEADDSGDEMEADIFGEGIEEDEHDDKIESKLEMELKKVHAKINAHEEQSMQAKSWQMLGESSQRDRENNALLEEHLQFDHGVRPAPEITIETTSKIEKLIIERIKVKLFDDVERKEKPVGRDVMKQKELPLNQEKSQLSLAEVYEKDYLAAQEEIEGAEKEEMNETEEAIKKDLTNLFRKLDALSNFAFAPKGVTEELKIVVNAPAVSIEEAIPTAVAETQILAPAEVKAKQKEELRTAVEETVTDKKRKRRKIKKSQSIKSNERDLKKLRLERESGGKKVKTKKDAISAVSEEVKQGITLAKKSSEKVNSNFFSKLQESINQEAANNPGKRKKSTKDAKIKKFNKFG